MRSNSSRDTFEVTSSGALLPRRGLRQRALELALDELDPCEGELIQRLEVLVASDSGVGDDQNPMAHVIERQHGVEQHEPGFVGFLRLRLRLQRHRLEPRRRVVAEIADRAAGEPWQPGNERRVKAGHQLAHRGNERLVRFRSLAGTIDDRLAASGAKDQERILPEERIPRHLLAAFDRFQQKRVVRVFGNLQERRHRRQHVRDDLFVDRHERPALGEVRELFEARYVHQTLSATTSHGVAKTRRMSS